MTGKFHINSIEELNDIVLKASRMRDQLVEMRQERENNQEWKNIATLIHEKRCLLDDKCSWNQEYTMNADITGEIISDDFVNWKGSERLLYAEKAKDLLSKFDGQTITEILKTL